MLFQQAFPELYAAVPVMPGQQHMAPSPLHRLRRQQLHDLAKAYGIQVKDQGTKAEILPLLIDAESRNVFRGPAVDDYYLRKAARSSDGPLDPLHGSPKLVGYKPPPVEEAVTNYKSPLPIDKQHISQIRKAAAEAGMKMERTTSKSDMLDFLASIPVVETYE